jgi:putative transposase
MIDSFWGEVQTELLNRQRGRTRLEPEALFEYLEIFHNRRRRHSSLGMLTPIEYELQLARRTRSMTTLQHPDSGEIQDCGHSRDIAQRLGSPADHDHAGSREVHRRSSRG